TRSGINSRSSGSRSWGSGGHDASIRVWRGSSAYLCWITFARERPAMASAHYAGGAGAKVAFAIMLVSIGALVLTGLDKRIETGLVDISPQWLTDITTRF